MTQLSSEREVATAGQITLPGLDPGSRPEVAAAWPVLEKTGRLISLDAYRGFIMLVLISGAKWFGDGFGIVEVARHFQGNGMWQFLAGQFSHVEWQGCSFWDLLMPSFIFMVGVAMPYSYSSRLAKGDSPQKIALHAVYRSVTLILLGTLGLLFLRDLVMFSWPNRISVTFDEVLPQIGFAYLFAFVLLGKNAKVQFWVAVGILVGYWLAFVLYPLPGVGFDYSSVGALEESKRFTGFFAHWNKNTNLAADFDRWFLNLIPRSEPFVFRKGGITTLNFIPTIATMIFGMITGEFLRSSRLTIEKLKGLLIAGSLFLLGGILLDKTLCPIVKALWTPSWVVYSSGWALLMLAAFFWLVEVKSYRRGVFPLVVVGMNPIAMYCMAHLLDDWIFRVWKKLLGYAFFAGLYGPMLRSLIVVFSLWLVSLVMYRRRIFIRI